jgi:hypothetical protein
MDVGKVPVKFYARVSPMTVQDHFRPRVLPELGPFILPEWTFAWTRIRQPASLPMLVATHVVCAWRLVVRRYQRTERCQI